MILNVAPPEIYMPGYGLIMDRQIDPKLIRQRRRDRRQETSSV